MTIASKYLISSVYRPPTALVDALTRFIDEFSGYLDDVQKIYRKAYICGDININLLKINENNNYNTFYPNRISNTFNDYFANIGSDLASNICADGNNEMYKQYLLTQSQCT